MTQSKLTEQQWETWQNMRLPVHCPRTTEEIVKFLEVSLEQYRGDLNDNFTRANIHGKISNFLQTLTEVHVIHDSLIICDESNNTPYTIDNHELHVDVYLKRPAKVEHVYIPIVIK